MPSCCLNEPRRGRFEVLTDLDPGGDITSLFSNVCCILHYLPGGCKFQSRGMPLGNFHYQIFGFESSSAAGSLLAKISNVSCFIPDFLGYLHSFPQNLVLSSVPQGMDNAVDKGGQARPAVLSGGLVRWQTNFSPPASRIEAPQLYTRVIDGQDSFACLSQSYIMRWLILNVRIREMRQKRRISQQRCRTTIMKVF